MFPPEITVPIPLSKGNILMNMVTRPTSRRKFKFCHSLRALHMHIHTQTFPKLGFRIVPEDTIVYDCNCFSVAGYRYCTNFSYSNKLKKKDALLLSTPHHSNSSFSNVISTCPLSAFHKTHF